MDTTGNGRGLVWDIISLFPWMQRVKPSKLSGQPISRSTFSIRVFKNTKQEGMHLNNANDKLCQILQLCHCPNIWYLWTFTAKSCFKYKVRTGKKETTCLQLQEYPHLPIDEASYLILSSYGWSTFKRQKNRAIIAFKAVHFYRYHMYTP